MKRIFGIAMLALPLAFGSAHANGWPYNFQASGSFSLRGSSGWMPQAGPWYLYWPLEAHFVAPAPTGYPYWPAPQGLPNMSIGGPAVPPPQVFAQQPYAAAPVAPPPVQTAPVPSNQVLPPPAQPAPQSAVPATPQLQLPPYLQPTSYHPTISSGQPPSYWYDR